MDDIMVMYEPGSEVSRQAKKKGTPAISVHSLLYNYLCQRSKKHSYVSLSTVIGNVHSVIGHSLLA